MTLAQINQAQPDLFGIIEINDNGTIRRFVKDKLKSWIAKNSGEEQTEIILTNEDEEPEPKERVHRRKPVIAIKDGKEFPFKSSAEAARTLKIDRTNIPHALSGKYRHVNGYQFKYAV